MCTCGIPKTHKQSIVMEVIDSTKIMRQIYHLIYAFLVLGVKGQIISECPYDIIVCPKIATKKFPRFLP
jgi:hypothetical protein